MNLHQAEEAFTTLCAQLCTDCHSYTAAKVRQHNGAMRQLSAWAEKINAADAAFQTEVYTRLLQSTDAVAAVNAASLALKYGVCTDTAVLVLERLQREAAPLTAFDAEMTLRVWRGEIPGRTL